jgi:large subunit ribosomal protein L4
MEATIYNTKGKEAGKITLPEVVFGTKWNSDLVHQVVVAMQANARTPVAHTKDRSEVQGTTRKPWKQKGTGNARHGSRRSPIWRTGGVAHGPRNEKNFKKQINKKMRVKALYAVLAKKYSDGEVLFVDTLAFDAPKTREAKTTIQALSKVKGFATLSTKKRNSALIADIDCDTNTLKSFQNMGNVAVEHVRNLNPVDLLKYKHLILVGGEEALQFILKRSHSVTETNK